MKIKTFAVYLFLCIVHTHSIETSVSINTDLNSEKDSRTESKLTKEKRQIASTDNHEYLNHRIESNPTNSDGTEESHATIYNGKPSNFIIRPIPPHQHHHHESHQEPQLRSFAVPNRPHATQLLEQSQEIEPHVFLQDIMRNLPKTLDRTENIKPHGSHTKKSRNNNNNERENINTEEGEQQYSIQTHLQPRVFSQAITYNRPILAVLQSQHQQQQNSVQQPYQIIPEEQFLKLLEEELQARSRLEAESRQKQIEIEEPYSRLQKPSTVIDHQKDLDRYYEHPQEQKSLPGSKYIQYVHQAKDIEATKYLPAPPVGQKWHQPQGSIHQKQHQQLRDILPPQIAYYQPQISYKTLPNHPLAKSSLEYEIEKLLAANKPSPENKDLLEKSNKDYENRQQKISTILPSSPTMHPRLLPSIANDVKTTQNTLLDANNRPFMPSLFKFTNFQAPALNYHEQLPHHLINSNKLGPVVYPTSTIQPDTATQPSHHNYRGAVTATNPRNFQDRSLVNKLVTSTPTTKSYEKAALIDNYDNQQLSIQFYPSPPDPIKHSTRAPLPSTIGHSLFSPSNNDNRRYVVPNVSAATPSQSSIYVSQGTGIKTQSQQTNNVAKLKKTLDDVKQLNLPRPGGKPLSQAEFQALVNAGYPLKAVPVPILVPYEQFIKDHPNYRNQLSIDYAHLMSLTSRQFSKQRYPNTPLEPSVQIVPSTSETKIQNTDLQYLRPIASNQKRNIRGDKDSTVLGSAPNDKN